MESEIVKVQQKSQTIKDGNYTEQVLVDYTKIENLIFNVRGVQVMLDCDLAELYGVGTKVLNQAVKRNIERFPERFMFQLNSDEYGFLRSQFVTSKTETRGGRQYLPYVFTEHGIAMLSSVLKSETAIQISIKIIDVFVATRHFLQKNAGLFQRLENVEKHQ